MATKCRWLTANVLARVFYRRMRTFLVVFLVGNAFILRALIIRSHPQNSASNDAEDDRHGHIDHHSVDTTRGVENDYIESQWRIVKSRQILDFREEEEMIVSSRKRRRSIQDDRFSSSSSSGGGGLFFGCSSLSDVRGREFLAAGWTKAVYKARYGGDDVAVKQVNFYGHDMNKCLNHLTPWECYRKSAAKIMKEIVLLRELTHPNVLKVLGFCIPNGDASAADEVTSSGLSLVTELGQSLDMIRLLQSSWEDRLRIVLGVTKLVRHLSDSPLGSLVMNDFRRQQFVLVNGELKLSDVDDIELEEPSCLKDDDCTSRHEAAELTVYVPCVGGRCRGYNEKQNIYNAGRHFVSFLLPHGTPRPLRARVDAIVSAYENVTWDSSRLLRELDDVRRSFVSGEYLGRTPGLLGNDRLNRDFEYLEHFDLPGLHDYRCQLTVSGHGCTLSVFDDLEAMDICREDGDCQAFVVTSLTSWTGRHITHFKSNFTSAVKNNSTNLYIKL